MHYRQTPRNIGSVLICRYALAHEMGEGAAQPRVRAVSCEAGLTEKANQDTAET